MATKSAPSTPPVSLETTLAKAKAGRKLTQAALGQHLDLSERRVRELFAEGVFPDAVNSKALKEADLDVCRVAYIRHLREQAAGRTAEVEEIDDDRNPDVQLALLRVEQRRITRIKRRKFEGELVERTDLRKAVSEAFARVKTVLLKISKKHAGKLASMDDEVAVLELLDDLIHEALEELAGTPVESIGEEIDPNDIDFDDVEE